MPPFVGLAFKLVMNGAGWLLSSRAGNVVAAFSIAWIASGLHRDHVWTAKVAAHSAALHEKHAQEVAREADAARDIAEASTNRATEDMSIAEGLKAQIDLLKKKDSPDAQNVVAAPGCINGDFIDRVRKLDAAGRGDRAARTAPSASELRKAGSASIAAQCRILAAFALENRAAAILANRRLVGDGIFYDDVRREFSAKRNSKR